MFQLGYNSFWNFSMQGSAAVQELLTRPDLTIEDLLDEDGLSVELKTLNQKLFDFLLKEENFKKLINYAIAEPDLDEIDFDQKRCYKYPFVCADVLSSDNQAIVCEFFKSKTENKQADSTKSTAETEASADDEVNIEDEIIEKENANSPNKLEKDTTIANINTIYLDYFFDFLEQKAVNLTSAGYFAKIVNNLFTKRPITMLSYIYEQRPKVLEKLVAHIYSKSLAEFLAKVLTFEPQIIVGLNEETLSKERDSALKLVLEKLKPECDIEEINNAAYLICEVFGKYATMHNSSEVLQKLLDRTTIDYFFKILRSENSISTCAVALVLGNIFAYYILLNAPKALIPPPTNEAGETEPQVTHHTTITAELPTELPLISALLDNLDGIVQFISNTSGEEIKSQYGAQMVPFGAARLKLVELLIIAMKANNTTIFHQLVETNLPKKLLNLIIRYEWNNMLHNQIEKIINLILDGHSEELKVALFQKASLVPFLAESTKDTEYSLPGKHARKIRKGYLGQLIKIANKIDESRDPVVISYIENNEIWKEFKQHTLNPANETNQINLGGRDPRAPIHEEEELTGGVTLELPSFMQKFQKFFNVKKSSIEEKDKEGTIDDETKQEENPDDDEDKHKDYEEAISKQESWKTTNEKPKIPTTQEKERDTHSDVIPDSSTPVRGRNSFGFIHRMEPKQHHDDHDEEGDGVWFSEPSSGNQSFDANDEAPENESKTHELEKAEYFGNQYWKKDTWHTPEDILHELENL